MTAVHAAAAALLLLAAMPMLPHAAAEHVCEDAVAATVCAGMEYTGACAGTTSDSAWGVGAWTFGGAHVSVGGVKHCGSGANESKEMHVRAYAREHHAWMTSEHTTTTNEGVVSESCTSIWRVRVQGIVLEDTGDCLVEPVYPSDLLLP